jgi:hypothetical protein
MVTLARPLKVKTNAGLSHFANALTLCLNASLTAFSPKYFVAYVSHVSH